MDATRPTYMGNAHAIVSVGGFTIGKWTTRIYGDRVKPHYHREAHFMFAIGEYSSRAQGSRPDRKSVFIINPPRLVHQDRFESPGSFVSISIADEVWDALSDFKSPTDPRHLEGLAPRALLRQIGRAAARGSDRKNVCNELCHQLLAVSSKKMITEKFRPRWLTCVEDLLLSPRGTLIGLEELSAFAGVHPSYLAATFAKLHGCTPSQFARARRIERAAALVRETARSLAEIAGELGFSDQSHFTHEFRDFHGTTPAEYRRVTG